MGDGLFSKSNKNNLDRLRGALLNSQVAVYPTPQASLARQLFLSQSQI
jgi:hypothetical protein